MDVDIMGQILGMPFNLIGQMSDPPFWNSAIFAAALSALLVSVANLILEDKKNKKVIYQRQQQAYSELRGRNDIIADIYESYAIAFTTFSVAEAIQNKIGIPCDPLFYKNRERMMCRVDQLTIDQIPIQYGKLVETLSLIPLIFENKASAVENVENLNKWFLDTGVPNLSDRYRSHVPAEIELLDPNITITNQECPALGLLSPEDTQRQIDMENSIISEANIEIKAEIRRCIREPVTALLTSMKNDL